MRIGEICVRVLNKNLLHILLCLRPCPWPCLCSAWFPFLAKWKKIDVPATRPAQPAGCLLHPQAEAAGAVAVAGSKAGAQAMPLCVVACIYSYRYVESMYGKMSEK